ncbi:MAG: acetyl-CoA synthetase, partial [Deltaproteobacteria bacterium]|nr:acetyl-CoA synthetase [Deltaproteobacteria bacterium]
VKAFVILKQDQEPSRELALDMFQHTINILAKFKIPRILEFVKEVPKTLSGKIRRVELREQEIDRQKAVENGPKQEYFYWDFPELKSKK